VKAAKLVLWGSLGLIAYAHAGYPLLLRAICGAKASPAPAGGEEHPALPRVTLVVAAHDEEDVIERKLDDALSQDYPAELLEVIVASDGSTDGTVEIARARAGSDARLRVLDLPRGGKVLAQDAAVAEASGELLAFSDANAVWERDALRRLVAPFADPKVGYACGELRYLSADGSNQEGAYWRYETEVRRMESRLGSITAGNGAIYAVRPAAYMRLDPRTSHDLSFPFNMVKRGWRAVCEPAAVAFEQPLPTNEGEFARKRRMMSHAWPAVVTGGMLDPRGYAPLYALKVYSHRLLRYATPFLHVAALVANVALVRRRAGRVYSVLLAGQAAFAAVAAAGRASGGRSRPAALAYYYVLTTASLAAGLWDWLIKGTPATWERAEGRG
jgi:cellulose synthase/poly-beta-1,6-N-acetylglucosamine synthase-like glycosyltransferase